MNISSTINPDLDTTGVKPKAKDVAILKANATKIDEPGHVWVSWNPSSESCDENQPACLKCKRHDVVCNYGPSIIKKISDRSDMGSSTAEEPGTDKIPDFPETAERRLQELTLLHHYTTNTSRTISFTTSTNYDQATIDMFTQTVPSIALTNVALLYSIYSISSFHLNHSTIAPSTSTSTGTSNPSFLTAYTYLDQTLRLHRQEIQHLTPLTADAICLTSSNLRICAFAMLQQRSRIPYTAPIDWLRINRGASMAFKAACLCIVLSRDVDVDFHNINPSEEALKKSVAWMFVRRMPVLADHSEIFVEANAGKFAHLLRRTEGDLASEEWDGEIEGAYRSTVCYLGYVYKHIEAKDDPATITRLLIGFPYFIEQRFVELVAEEQPRAMVLLAVVFALFVRIRKIWWIGNCGDKEVRGIFGMLGDEWGGVKEEIGDLVREGEEDVYEFL
ncbi:hypothetical protein SBOR_2135 [Sclerotinia borealis F-4128]|uniref:Zn(2)-C6 fungal-type domain-containing protein n=1 Tax=Sclerotinia borealis (strain F-4128) TaxID=1432307 RepID=W9CNM9_SCLBF|nr:hypothetical protein SBOR_2135 [Sclerotinia borealis F-4128]